MRALLIGAGVALTAGFLMGSAMKPDLLADHRPEGPQTFAGWNGESTGPFDPGVSFAAYRGKVPDYVIGTDALRASQPVAYHEEVQAEPVEVAANDPMPQADDYTAIAYHEAPPEPVTYPSLDGGTAYAPAVESGQAG